jgi:hypothetical protein
MDQQVEFVDRIFESQFRDAVIAGDADRVKTILGQNFANLPAEDAVVLERQVLAATVAISRLPYPILACLADGFGWESDASPMAISDPETLACLRGRLNAARLYEGVGWQAGRNDSREVARRQGLHGSRLFRARPAPRVRRAAATMLGRSAPAEGLYRITWTPSLYRNWIRRIESQGPASYDYFDRQRVRWLKICNDAIEELSLARACVIGGASLAVVTRFMMWFYEVIPQDVHTPEACAGIVAVSMMVYAALSRYLPR